MAIPWRTGGFMIKKILEEVSVGLAALIIFWLVLSTIDVNNKNLTTQEYAEWNIWRLFEESEPIHVISEQKPVKGTANYSVMNNMESPFISLGEFKVTGYCGCALCCGKTDCKTATGTHATQGRTIAVDPSVIPYGSEVIIDGHTYFAEDCGGSIKNNRIDIFFSNHAEALKYGVRYSEVILCRKQ